MLNKLGPLLKDAWSKEDVRRYWRFFGGITLLNIVLIWWLPILPCQDLPQHLAYARILRDFQDGDLPFSHYYALPGDFQSYYATHYLLAYLGRPFGILGALRLVMSAYAIALPLAFHAIVQAIHGKAPPGKPHITGLLGLILVWNSVVVMGFLPFFLALPFLFAAIALFIRLSDGPATSRGEWAGLALCVGVMVSLHIVTAGALVLLAIVFTLTQWTRRRAALTGTIVALILVAQYVWSTAGSSELGSSFNQNWRAMVQNAYGLEFVNQIFNITWYDPPTWLSYALWAIAGPFRLGAIGLVLGAAGVAVSVILGVRREIPPAPAPDEGGNRARRMVITAIAFFVVCWHLPWGFYVPAELTFLNFRMFVIAFAVILAVIPPRVFVPRKATLAAMGFVAFYTLHFAMRAISFNREADAALSLNRRLTVADGPQLSIVLHHHTSQFGKVFRLTHFLPMYYTILQGGIETQFWARYTPHLPVDMQKGRALGRAPDWEPEKLVPENLVDSTTMLIQWPADDDNTTAHNTAQKIRKIIADRTDLVACEGLWCLYRIRHPVPNLPPPKLEGAPGAKGNTAPATALPADGGTPPPSQPTPPSAAPAAASAGTDASAPR